MKIEEAIVYVMVKRNGGMTTDQIADAINTATAYSCSSLVSALPAEM